MWQLLLLLMISSLAYDELLSLLYCCCYTCSHICYLLYVLHVLLASIEHMSNPSSLLLSRLT